MRTILLAVAVVACSANYAQAQYPTPTFQPVFPGSYGFYMGSGNYAVGNLNTGFQPVFIPQMNRSYGNYNYQQPSYDYQTYHYKPYHYTPYHYTPANHHSSYGR